jgi:uncharacterized protein YdbL (DUF1318 family)
MIRRLFTLCAVLGALFTSTAVFAESAGEIRARMVQRLAQVDDLKAKGTVGENNRGFLEVRGSGSDAERLVNDENRDREVVYALIARETGASADSVGRARAKQIAASSKPGVWIQDESGAWKKK